MPEEYTPISNDQIKITTTTEQIVSVEDLSMQRYMCQQQVDNLAEDMAVIDSKLAVINPTV